MIKNLLLVFTVSFSFLGVDCNDEPPVKPPEKTNPLQLTVEDVSCTEAWLKLSLAESEANRTLTLMRSSDGVYKKSPFGGFRGQGEAWDSTIVTMTITLAGKDTLFLDTLLLPNKTYTYTLIKPTTGEQQEWSVTAQVTTMDTTSSDWVWSVEQIGSYGSYLYDVAIVNDTLAFAVGEIDDGDTGTGEKLYNVAKWDGKKWELMKVTWQGSFGYLNTVFAINDSNVWFAPWIHWDGRDFQSLPFDPIFTSVKVNKLWGNAEELWAVGNDGWTGEAVIVRRSAATGKWQKIESGTTATLFDVWGGNPEGAGNKWLGENVVLVAGTYFPTLDPILLQIKNGSEIDSLPLPVKGQHVSTWFNENSPVYISGTPALKYTSLTGWRKDTLSPYFFTRRIRGNNSNDIIAVGYPTISHFNGVSWEVYDGAELQDLYFISVAIKGNLSIAVGFTGGFSIGIVAIGRR